MCDLVDRYWAHTYQTAGCHIPEDCTPPKTIICINIWENLKSRLQTKATDDVPHLSVLSYTVSRYFNKE